MRHETTAKLTVMSFTNTVPAPSCSLYSPGSQESHVSIDVAPVAGDAVPARHKSHDVEPADSDIKHSGLRAAAGVGWLIVRKQTLTKVLRQDETVLRLFAQKHGEFH